MYDNFWDEGTLTFSSQQTNFPATNTRHRWHTRSWRSDGILGPGEWINNDRGVYIAPVGAALIRYGNFSEDAVITVNGYEFGNPVPIFTDVIDANRTITTLWVPDQALQIWEFLVVDAANPDGYIEIGRPYIGHYFEPSRIFSKYTPEPVDPSKRKYSSGGQITSVVLPQYMKHYYLFKGISETEKQAFEAMFASQGNVKGLFFCEDYVNPTVNNTFYVVINSFRWEFIHEGFWNLELELEDCR